MKKEKKEKSTEGSAALDFFRYLARARLLRRL